MNRIKTLVLLVTAATLQTALSLKAQQEMIKVKVPFQFSMGNRTLPPGEYRVTRHHAFLTIESRRDSSSALVSTSSDDSSRDSRVRLIFDRVNDLYFLREVVAPAGTIELALSSTEKKVRRNQPLLSKVSLPVVPSTIAQPGGR